jgi:hypothetical protein
MAVTLAMGTVFLSFVIALSSQVFQFHHLAGESLNDLAGDWIFEYPRTKRRIRDSGIWHLIRLPHQSQVGGRVTSFALAPPFRLQGTRRAIEDIAVPFDIPSHTPQALGELVEILSSHRQLPLGVSPAKRGITGVSFGELCQLCRLGGLRTYFAYFAICLSLRLKQSLFSNGFPYDVQHPTHKPPQLI